MDTLQDCLQCAFLAYMPSFKALEIFIAIIEASDICINSLCKDLLGSFFHIFKIKASYSINDPFLLRCQIVKSGTRAKKGACFKMLPGVNIDI